MTQTRDGGLSLAVWVTPGAQRSALAGVVDGRLRVRLAAPPVEGRANAELVRFVAQELRVTPRAVSLSAGGRSRRKLLHVAGVTLDDARRRLGL
ncbi:MAG TPA: DUF167 domain-containing protein [Thermoleophilia bacterium]|nr:DUF167 domain-containing protein [Actinomycetota bacterium]HQF51611.1 DUF167 domain-containing protein [Thermoleophilia bacterium]